MTCNQQRRWVAPLLVATGIALALNAGLHGQSRAQEEQRERRQRVGDIFTALGVRPGAVIADIGAGSGFFTVRLAHAVGQDGRVLAVDIAPSAIRSLRKRVADESLTNVEVITGEETDPHLPDASLDGALIVNAYHEMTEHQSMLAHVRRALKPSGRLVIVEPISASRREVDRLSQERQHEIAPQYVQQDARAAGFTIVGFEDPFAAHMHGSEFMLVLSPSDPAALETPEPDRDHGEVEDMSAANLRISSEEFGRLFRAGEVIVLDVRDVGSYERGHIPGARVAPMSELKNEIDALKNARQPIVTYCSCPAEETSARAAAFLRRNGVKNVRALAGGFDKWEAGGNPVAKGQ